MKNEQRRQLIGRRGPATLLRCAGAHRDRRRDTRQRVRERLRRGAWE
jgi:hypothetical protein